MKQNLYINLMLYENKEELLLSENYQIYIDEDKLCILWKDVYEKENTFCEPYWL